MGSGQYRGRDPRSSALPERHNLELTVRELHHLRTWAEESPTLRRGRRDAALPWLWRLHRVTDCANYGPDTKPDHGESHRLSERGAHGE